MAEAVPAASANGLRLVGAMLSDVGRVRTLNEDAVAFVVPAADDTTADRDSLLLVADGMGGHAAGEIASALAAEVVRRVYFSLTGEPSDLLLTAFVAANEAIQDYGEQHPESRGLGTTCTALAVRGDKAWLAHVGDSRSYLLREDSLTQLSEDQTLVAKMVREGAMTAEEAKVSTQSNLILQALGTRPTIEPQLWTEALTIVHGDTLILCTDGLHGLISDEVMMEIVDRLPPLDACHALIRSALEAGGHDNVSVGVFHVLETPRPSTGRERQETRPMPALREGADASDELNRATRRISAFTRPT